LCSNRARSVTVDHRLFANIYALTVTVKGQMPGCAAACATHDLPGPAALTLTGAMLLLRAAAALKSDAGKYVAPAARRAAAQRDENGDGMSERMIWDALDEGRDPTSTDNEGR